MNSADRLCLALDTDESEALAWVDRTAAHIGWFKVGMRLFYRAGPPIIARLRDAGARSIFLDLKLHDIPNTVGDAAGALAELGVDMLTVHAGGGVAMMRAAATAAPTVRVVGVTVLTSLTDSDLGPVGLRGPPAELARRRAEAAQRAGLAGVVCSGHEARALRATLGPDAVLVVPGVRFADGSAQDQARVTTPAAAVRAGADLLVIGRMVRSAADPDAAVARLQAEIADV